MNQKIIVFLFLSIIGISFFSRKMILQNYSITKNSEKIIPNCKNESFSVILIVLGIVLLIIIGIIMVLKKTKKETKKEITIESVSQNDEYASFKFGLKITESEMQITFSDENNGDFFTPIWNWDVTNNPLSQESSQYKVMYDAIKKDRYKAIKIFFFERNNDILLLLEIAETFDNFKNQNKNKKIKNKTAVLKTFPLEHRGKKTAKCSLSKFLNYQSYQKRNFDLFREIIQADNVLFLEKEEDVFFEHLIIFFRSFILPLYNDLIKFLSGFRVFQDEASRLRRYLEIININYLKL